MHETIEALSTPVRQPEPLIGLREPLHCHVIGVGGPGMSAVALLMSQMGHHVTGSDVRESDVIDQLRESGIEIAIGHDASLVDDADVVTFSTAIPDSNIELVRARERGIAIRHRSGMLASMCAATNAVGVAGTHGKTTTSALLAAMVTASGLQPSTIIGAELPGQGVGARYGDGSLLVIEADESDGTLDVLPLSSIVITNVDVDHLDYFSTFEAVQECFLQAAQRASQYVVVNIDDPGSAHIAQVLMGDKRLVTFGTSPSATVRIVATSPTVSGLSIELMIEGVAYACQLPLRGMHNAFNCAAAMAMAVSLGVAPQTACDAVEDFAGVARRFTERGTFGGALLVDDYAHLPAEIEAAIAAARSHPSCSGRVVAVFQPNRFHRIATMADTYANCFRNADRIVITDVYASGTPRIEGVTGELVVKAVKKSNPGAEVVWAPQRADVVAAVAQWLSPGDVCLSMGCGDIETFPDDLREAQS